MDFRLWVRLLQLRKLTCVLVKFQLRKYRSNIPDHQDDTCDTCVANRSVNAKKNAFKAQENDSTWSLFNTYIYLIKNNTMQLNINWNMFVDMHKPTNNLILINMLWKMMG